MKALIAIVIIAAAAMVGWQVYTYWTDIEAKDNKDKKTAVVETVASPEVSGNQLPGMVPSLEASLDSAQKLGATGLRNWLTRYGKTVKDPRLAWIELDYVVLVTREDTAEAKKVFARVKQRIQPNSPVYPRIKKLERTYE